MNLKLGDIIINGFIVEIFEGVIKEGVKYPKDDWRGEKVYIYDGLGDSSEEEIKQVIDYIYSEGFIQDRRTDHVILRPEDFE